MVWMVWTETWTIMALFLGTDGHLFDIYLAFSGVVRHRGGEGHLGCKTGWSCVMSGRRWNCVKRDGRFRIGLAEAVVHYWEWLTGVWMWCMDVAFGCTDARNAAFYFICN